MNNFPTHSHLAFLSDLELETYYNCATLTLNDKMISVRFQGKPFNITVIQVYAPTSNAEAAEVEWLYEDL